MRVLEGSPTQRVQSANETPELERSALNAQATERESEAVGVHWDPARKNNKNCSPNKV